MPIESLVTLAGGDFNVAVSKPAKAASGPKAFEAASGGRRLASWKPTTVDINSLIWANGDLLRGRSRTVVRQNPIASKGVDSWVANLISTGIKPQWVDSAINKDYQEAFLRWTDEADAYGNTDYYGLEALAARSMIEGGECFGRLRPRRTSDGMFVPLQVQLLEAEHCPLGLNEDLSNGNKIRCGIEFNNLGKRVAYYLYPEHPGSTSFFSSIKDTQRVPASQVIHLFRPLQPGQIRGIPWLAPVLVKLFELDAYDDAELVRKKIAALFAGFITENNPSDAVIGSESEAGLPDGVQVASLEPGTMQKLLPGENVTFSNPAEVGGQYETFMRVQMRQIAAGMSGLTYEQLTGDLTGVNYSSIRAGLLEFRRSAEQIQHQVIIHQFCRPIINKWVESAVLVGVIKAPNYAADAYPYKNVRHIVPGWPWVDPLKDITAKIQEIQAGLTSRSIAVAATGEDTEQIDSDQAADNARADKLKLRYTSDGRIANPETDDVKDTQAGASERSGDDASPLKEPKTGPAKKKALAAALMAVMEEDTSLDDEDKAMLFAHYTADASKGIEIEARRHK